MRCLVDTNVISELRKGERANRGVMTWFEGSVDRDLYLSVLTAGELRRGIETIRRRDPRAAATLDRWLRSVVRDFAERLLPVDRRVAEEWGRLNAVVTRPVVDGLLAATAAAHNLVLVTRNIRDMADTGVELLNPFS